MGTSFRAMIVAASAMLEAGIAVGSTVADELFAVESVGLTSAAVAALLAVLTGVSVVVVVSADFPFDWQPMRVLANRAVESTDQKREFRFILSYWFLDGGHPTSNFREK